MDITDSIVKTTLFTYLLNSYFEDQYSVCCITKLKDLLEAKQFFIFLLFLRSYADWTNGSIKRSAQGTSNEVDLRVRIDLKPSQKS